MHSIKKIIYGRIGLQPLFEKALSVSIGGMNLGNMDIEHNGEQWLIKEIGRRDPYPVIFDVGANIGGYAQVAVDTIGERLTMHCFEPSPAAFQQLEARFAGTRNVVLNNIGLGAVDGETRTLLCNTLGGTGSSIVSKEVPDGQWKYPLREQVQLRTLDAYVEQAGIRHISLLKIDVEGLELEVLRGSACSLTGSMIDCIQFEFGEGALAARTYFRDFYELLSPHYRLGRLVANGWRPIHKYSVTLEQFVTGNYLAFRRDRDKGE